MTRSKYFKPLGVMSVLFRYLTSWYVTAGWVLLVMLAVGEPVFYAIFIAACASVFSYFLWKDYDPELDGQITWEELTSRSDDDISI
jgi:hypothetical protein